MAAQKADQDARNAQAGVDVKAMEANRSLAAAAMEQSGQLQRESLQQQGATRRTLVDAALEQQKVNQAGLAAGYTNRAASLVEAMRNQVAAQTDPTKRRGLVQHMLDIEGKTQAQDAKSRYLTVGGGERVQDGQTVKDPMQVYDTQTGQWVQQPQGQVSQPSNLRSNLLRFLRARCTLAQMESSTAKTS